ncbi:MAG: lytic transglycosylase domain-containing protein [Magnetococcales bacterium]|nr:lytic transglycosylase domain-containing protein [Magnetococcales bacterium]
MIRIWSRLTLAAALVPLWTGLAAAGLNEDVAVYKRYFDAVDRGALKELPSRGQWPKVDVLASYLDLELLEARESDVEDILHFLHSWPDHPQSARLRKLVDQRIAKEGSNEMALAWLDQRPPTNAGARGRYIQLLIKAGRIPEALPHWQQHYRTGGALPRNLLEVVQPHVPPGTPEEHEARAVALFKGNRMEEFRQTLALLPKERRLFFKALEAAGEENGKRFQELLKQLPSDQARHPDLWEERIETIRQSATYQAADLLTGSEGGCLAPAARQLLRFKVGRHLLYNLKDPFNAYKVLSGNAREGGADLEDSTWLAGWSAYLTNDRQAAGEMFEILAKQGKKGEKRSQGAFWAARIAHYNGQDPQPWLRIAAQNPEHFYGLLALEELGEKISDIHDHGQGCQPLMERPELKEGLLRMKLLREVGLSSYVGGEISAMGELLKVEPQGQVCLALEFQSWDRAVKVAKETAEKGGDKVWSGLFPIPNGWTPSIGWKLDPALVWAMVRQESLFQPRAVSSAGARGLMQLMPETAAREAKVIRVEVPNKQRLQIPSYNLTLGQSHISRLLEEYNGDLLLALTAYNAGGGRTKQWRPNRGVEDDLAFIENITISETREYVKKILHGVAIYRQEMYGQGALRELIPPQRPGVADLRIKAGGRS